MIDVKNVVGKLNLKIIVLGAICVGVFIVTIFGGKYLIYIQKYKKIVEEIKINYVDLSKISNGTYIGSCDALVVASTVSVTVKDNKIVNITLLKHKTERGKPAEVIPEKVIKSQSLQVDTVTGATNSSKVILKSIENALDLGKS